MQKVVIILFNVLFINFPHGTLNFRLATKSCDFFLKYYHFLKYFNCYDKKLNIVRIHLYAY